MCNIRFDFLELIMTHVQLHDLFAVYAERGKTKKELELKGFEKPEMEYRFLMELVSHSKLIDKRMSEKDVQSFFTKHCTKSRMNAVIDYKQFKCILSDIAEKRGENLEQMTKRIVGFADDEEFKKDDDAKLKYTKDGAWINLNYNNTCQCNQMKALLEEYGKDENCCKLKAKLKVLFKDIE